MLVCGIGAEGAVTSSGSFLATANVRSIGGLQMFDAAAGEFTTAQSSANYRVAAGWIPTLDLIGAPVTPTVNAPAPGTTLPGSQLNLSWNPNRAGVREWRVVVGRSVGGSELADSGSIGTNTTYTASGMPTDGGVLHVRLWYRTDEGWGFEDVFYRAGGADTGPAIASPTPGSVLAGPELNLSWTPNGVSATDWRIYVGSHRGARDLADSGNLANVTSHNLANLPTDGRVIHVRLWYFEANVWRYRDFEFAAGTVGGTIAPAITVPAIGSELGPSAGFAWSANTTLVTAWWLRLGSRPGAADLFDSGSMSGTSIQAGGLPLDGRTIYARLWYRTDGRWRYRDFNFRAGEL